MMNFWARKGRSKGTLCFLFCFLLLICLHSSENSGWSPQLIVLTTLASLNLLVLILLFYWIACKPKQKDAFRNMEEGRSSAGVPLLAEDGRLHGQLAHLQGQIEWLQEEKAQLKEENGQLQGQLERLQEEKEFLKIQRHKVDVSLDADTAHPRLEVSQDGKRVSDTGTAIKVPRTEKRFDSHTFLLAKEGYTSGKYYWEVDVGKRRNWDVGIARESVTRKGTLTLSPEEGFWVIGLADGQDYWARTEPWTRLVVSGKPRKIGIFLDVSAKKLSFFNVSKKTAMYTFTLGGENRQEGKFFPFFSTRSPSAKPDTEPLKIVLGFEEDPDDE
ncbi:butyrophilin subfamily 1 member A1-like [Apteryx mantelli]|uniref:Butyrophilin subfamily 1 member A1-like n=1 Tax=Apteryx mantelli TaxID=2696672 RepID=A0ABM4FZI9_9AVES